MKLLMWLAFFVLVIAALFVKQSRAVKSGLGFRNEKAIDASGIETMLSCAHCGVYFPASEAIHFHDAVYCCTEHCGKPTAL